MGSEEDLDSEWEEFERVMTEYNTKRRNVLASPIFHRRHLDDLCPSKDEELRQKAHQKEPGVFYPCPLAASAEDLYNYDPFATQMYGRYTKELGEYAKDEAIRLGLKRNKLKEEIGGDIHRYCRGKCASKLTAGIAFVWKHTLAKLGDDWVFLGLLGVLMAILSFFVDYGINFINKGRLWLYKDLSWNPVMQYVAWVSLPTCLILFSAGFVHLVAPQAIGSGIPEMKTILRGVTLKEYLTFRTLIAKVIGLTTTLGAGLPLGKEGPFVHISSMMATLLSKLITSFKGIYENESRNTEMLAAACAVGVASCFGVPIGGVLMSIEVTTAYFAVRNYWRGFFAAVSGATVFRLLAVLFDKADTVKAFFPTHFTMEYPFDPQELTVFALIGILSGFGGAVYVWCHKQYVLFMRKSKRMNAFLKKNRFLYPGLVTFLAATVTFPHGLGKYIASDLAPEEQLIDLFSNFTWTKDEFSIKEREVLEHWTTDHTNVFINLSGYIVYFFIFSIICSTIPVPSGSFIPVFKIGAAVGRIIGEMVHMYFPNGVRHGKYVTPVVPGGYATVGGAAFSGAVTHSFSVCVVAMEMTGQITHIVPMMIAVLIANAIAALLQPSLYDSIILIKKLPYLPDVLPSNSGIYDIFVEDFMRRDVKFLWKNMTYKDLKQILKDNKTIHVFPVVHSPDSRILLGSVQRLELIRLIEYHVGRERRLEVVAKWQKEAQERLNELEKKRYDSQRRPSRFDVTLAPDILKMKQFSNSEQIHSNTDKTNENLSINMQPKKSILKKTNSFNLHSYPNLMQTTAPTPYSTVTGAESRIRLAFEAIFHKSATLKDANPDIENGSIISDKPSASPAINKKVQLPRERVIDMSPEDQREWENAEMEQTVNFEHCRIDPAPFQLVERTSLLKVHSIFSLVGVNHAYVTAVGRLIGVVSLKELRKAIEESNAGTLPRSQTEQVPDQNPAETSLLKDEDEDSVISDSVNSTLSNKNIV